MFSWKQQQQVYLNHHRFGNLVWILVRELDNVLIDVQVIYILTLDIEVIRSVGINVGKGLVIVTVMARLDLRKVLSAGESTMICKQGSRSLC